MDAAFIQKQSHAPVRKLRLRSGSYQWGGSCRRSPSVGLPPFSSRFLVFFPTCVPMHRGIAFQHSPAESHTRAPASKMPLGAGELSPEEFGSFPPLTCSSVASARHLFPRLEEDAPFNCVIKLVDRKPTPRLIQGLLDESLLLGDKSQ